MLTLSHISSHIIIFCFQFFIYIYFKTFSHLRWLNYLKIKISFNLLIFQNSHFHLPLHLPTTFYFNIINSLPFYLPLFWLFLFSTSYYIVDIFFFILCIVFSHKKGHFSLSLSLSLSLYIFVWIFLFLLHQFFRLMKFCVNYNSTLGWCNLVLCFKLLSFIFSLIKYYPTALYI